MPPKKPSIPEEEPTFSATDVLKRMTVTDLERLTVKTEQEIGKREELNKKVEKADSTNTQVIRTLGSIPLGQWVSFIKMGVPGIATLVAVFVAPMNFYLDQREDALKAMLKRELIQELQSSAGLSKEELQLQLGDIRKDMDALYTQLKDKVDSPPSSLENMRQIGKIKERLARLEARSGVTSSGQEEE